MPREFPRSKRVAEQIQRILAEVVSRGQLKLTGVELATFTEVEISRDLSHAKVYVSKIGSDDPSPVVEILNKHAKPLRSELARQMRMRTVPSLKFFADVSTAHGDYMDRLIDQARSTDANLEDTEANEEQGEQS